MECRSRHSIKEKEFKAQQNECSALVNYSLYGLSGLLLRLPITNFHML